MRRGAVSWTVKLKPELDVKLVADRKQPGKTLLIPTPLAVAEEMRKVRKGRTLLASVLRERLAERFGADATCPLVTGILINIVAGATEEQWEEGRRRAFAPYWRIVRDDGVLSEKLPLGAARQAELLKEEGHTVRQRNGKWRFEG